MSAKLKIKLRNFRKVLPFSEGGNNNGTLIMADNSDSGSSAVLGVIVGAMLVVLVAVFAFGGGFNWIRGGGSPDMNVRIEAPPQAPPSG